MTTLRDCLGNKQKEILTLIENKDIEGLREQSWSMIYVSIPTFECLGLTHFNKQINYREQLERELTKKD